MADMTKLQEAGRLPDADGTLTAGTCDAILKVPPGWDEIATANWRTLQQDMATRKSLCSRSPKPSGN
jgi:hypothetical protein